MELKHFEIREEVFESPSLRGNPLGDPVVRRVPVILPRGHGPCREAPGPGSRGAARDPARQRYPAVFVLAGFASSGQSFLNWHGWTPSLPERLDRLRDQGLIGDLIAVLPDGFTRYGGSQYLNSTATGAYEDMIVKDLVTWTDARFSTLPEARHRAIVGKSSGGYGALVLGMRHPDVFSAVACHAGDMYFEYCYGHDFPRLLKLIEKHGGLEGFLEAFVGAPKKTTDLVLSMNIVAMAAAYSPRADAPCGFDLPVDVATGEIRRDVWSRWLEHDPVRLCDRYAENLKKLGLVYLDCGRFDQFHLQYGMRILVKRLRSLGIPHVAEEFDDDHSDTSYRYDVSLPRVWEHVKQGPG